MTFHFDLDPHLSSPFSPSPSPPSTHVPTIIVSSKESSHRRSRSSRLSYCYRSRQQRLDR